MRICVTAGPTREPIDAVRFITNASSGRMGYAVAAAALAAGHEAVLLTGPVCLDPPEGAEVVSFVTVDDLAGRLAERFPRCDALVMAAAVGDFRVESPASGKISRRGGPVSVRLVPTEDVLAGVAAGKRPGQVVMAFAAERGDREAMAAKARSEMAAKGADLVVCNPASAMGAADSEACILSAEGVVVPWARRQKGDLAAELIRVLAEHVNP